jgi:hypothetical protein
MNFPYREMGLAPANVYNLIRVAKHGLKGPTVAIEFVFFIHRNNLKEEGLDLPGTDFKVCSGRTVLVSMII